jgi:hypothetical protein
MSTYAVLYFTERSTFAANMPTSAEIQSALMRAATLTLPPGSVRFVGPAPRIVRIAVLGAIVTHIAWLVEGTDSPALQLLATNVDTMSQAFSGDFTPATMQAYTPSYHGDLQWWQSGDAAKTVTRDIPRADLLALGRTYTENPVGPTQNDWGYYARVAALTAVGGALLYTGVRVINEPALRRSLAAKIERVL